VDGMPSNDGMGSERLLGYCDVEVDADDDLQRWEV